MTTEAATAQIDGALQGLRQGLNADGYDIEWTVAGGASTGEVAIRVVAGPDACADCLVPGPVMQAIMSEALSAAPFRGGEHDPAAPPARISAVDAASTRPIRSSIRSAVGSSMISGGATSN